MYNVYNNIEGKAMCLGQKKLSVFSFILALSNSQPDVTPILIDSGMLIFISRSLTHSLTHSLTLSLSLLVSFIELSLIK
jgi:hypothetical protein